jgi:DNA-binding IscR family transcriptional regulator
MTLPKMAIYAVMILRKLRQSDAPVASSKLAEWLGKETQAVQQLMKPLSHAGLVTGIMGPHGGWALAHPKHRVTGREVFDALRLAAEREETPEFVKVEKQISEYVDAALDKLLVDDLK